MTLQSRSHVLSIIAAASALLVAEASTMAQADPPAGSKPTDSGILAGPKVEPEAQTENDGRMNPQGQRMERREVEVPFYQWMTLVRQLELTDEQKSKADGIAAEFRQAQEEFTEAQGEDGKELFRAARKARQSGERLDPELRQKLRAIEEGRPKPGPYQERIWAELNDVQQSELKAKLDEAMERMKQRRGRAQGGDDAMNPEGDRRRRAAQDQPMNEAPPEPMMEPGKPGEGESSDQPAPQRRRLQRGGENIKLDEIGQRRLKFLLSRQAADARGKHPTGEPAASEREFRFDEPE